LFKGTNGREVLKANRACDYDLSELKRKKISSSGKDLLKKMLEAEPKKRISS